MNIEKVILDFIKSKNKRKNIAGLRGLVKTGEEEWSFRYTFQEGNHLSISEIIKVRLEGLNKIDFILKDKKHKKSQIKNKKSKHGKRVEIR